MKKIKVVLWIIVAAFVALLFYQNKDFFLAPYSIALNLSYVAGIYNSPSLPLAVWFLITLIIGLLVSYFFGLAERFKLKKTIKGLNAKIDTQIEMISQIRSELESHSGLPNVETPAASPDIVKTAHEPSDVQVLSDD